MPENNDAIQQLLAQYDLGDTGGDPYEGSVPRQVAPQQQRQAGIPATRAVPPKDPETGRFLPAQVQPSAPNAQKQVQSEDPLLTPGGEPIQHTRTLYRHAIQTGFTDAEIDSTPSEQLQDQVFTRQREMLERAQQTPAPNVSAVEKPAPKPEPDPEVNFGEFESDDNLDPKLRGVLKSHLTSQLKKLKELEAKLEASNKLAEERAKQDQRRAMDNHIDKMLSKHANLLGSASVSELTRGSREFVMRKAVLEMAQADSSSRSNQEKIDAAVASLFGAPAAVEPEQPGARPTAQQWANGGVPRPTNRKPAPEINDVRRATKEVENRLAQLSQPGSNGSVDKDDFPE